MNPHERQVVERPGLPPYRARKPPEALLVTLNGYTPGILVVRCHDLDVANVLAFARFLEAHPEGPRTLPTSEAWGPFVAGVDPLRLWVRWVFDHEDPTVGVWERELRGTIGATPAVLFARSTHPDTEEPTP